MKVDTVGYMYVRTYGGKVTKTKFSRTDELQYFFTNGAPRRRCQHVEIGTVNVLTPLNSAFCSNPEPKSKK